MGVRYYNLTNGTVSDQAKAQPRSLARSQPTHRFVLFVSGRKGEMSLGEMQRVLAITRDSRV
jgi:hypothetical protein